MSEPSDKLRKTLDDVEKLRIQIENILSSLKANKDLFETDVTPVGFEDFTHSLPPAVRSTHLLQSEPSTLLSKLSRQRKDSGQINTAIRNSNQSRLRSDDELGILTHSKGMPEAQDVNTLQSDLPAYTYLESETFLLPIIDRWFWGTTICNTSKSAVLLPDLNLSIVGSGVKSSAFTYNFNISLFDSEGKDPGSHGWYEDIPYQEIFGFRRTGSCRLQPGSKARITASFESPIDFGSAEGETRILATLSLNGKAQWSHAIDLGLTNLCSFRDDIYKRFQPQIFGAMSHCQSGFKLKGGPTLGISSLSNAFRHFLTSLGFELIHSGKMEPQVSLNFYTCDLPSLIFGAMAQVEQTQSDPSSIRIALATRSPIQMESLLRLLANWSQKTASEQKTGFKEIFISNLSPEPLDDKRMALLAEIEVLTHLVLLNQQNVLNNYPIGPNWIKAYAAAMHKTDSAFISPRNPMP